VQLKETEYFKWRRGSDFYQIFVFKKHQKMI